jgi:outer membrane protein assembly factor BamB
LYALGSDGDLACLDAKSGEIRWQRNVRNDFDGQNGQWAYSESPLIDGEKVICTPGGSDATLVALNSRNGEVIWKTPVPAGDAAAYASAVITEVNGQKQYVQFLAKGLVGVDAETGKLSWRYDKIAEGSPANIPTPVTFANFVYGGSSKGGASLIELQENQGEIAVKELYHNAKLPTGIGGSVRVGDYLYGTTGQGLLCVKFDTGEVMWQDRSIGAGSVCYADGRLYLHGDQDDVALVEANPKEYVERGRFSLPDQPDRAKSKSWTYPVIANGRLYLRDLNVVWCYGIRRFTGSL